ncbi:hypothetical protein B0T21DRAFT_382912 [Apiosordaria backusii]|uniref:Uncharacterized protein n=1 Tax=Apiosordaria backusii TaxID=314023 RepID=A0AA40BMD9_9PEZI|nr:hypothetical protein B0T21DRAFT_382912 [Apiosordaria backusii]
MLDENLPTFRFKPSSDDPLSTILYFTQNGSEPSPEYLLRRPDPALPASHNKYGVALCDPFNQNVIYGEITVEPEWTLPTLSAAEIRAQAQSGAPPAPATAIIPDNFSIQLYNPDQTITVKMVVGAWNKSDSWEFEIPVQTFKTPTTSELDREQQNSSPAAADLIPRIMFRWKKEGKLSKDMTCYMTGRNTAGKKSKEPDITVAMYKGSRESAMTLYQPNLHRVEVEDRKGLELVLLLGAEVIKDLYINPKPGMFNVSATSPGPIPNTRKNSRPNVVAAAAVTPTPPAAPPAAMSGALNNLPPTKSTTPTSSKPQSNNPPPTTTANTIPPPPPSGPPKHGVTFTTTPTASIEAETRRLQELVEREQREREKAERAEQKRIKKMLEEEEKAQRKREAEIAKETERLRKKYGVEGQDLPSDRPSLPPRPSSSVHNSPSVAQQPFFPGPPTPPQQQQQQQHTPSWLGAPAPALPPRPLSAGPPAGGSGGGPQQQQGPFHCNKLNLIWKGAAGQLEQVKSQVESRMSPELQAKLSQTLPHRPGGGRKEGEDGGRRRVQRKRSSGF